MKRMIGNIFLFLLLLVGLSLLLYPEFSNRWNQLHGTRVIADYTEAVGGLTETQYNDIWDEAVEYNKTLVNKERRFVLSDEEKKIYKSLLRVESGEPMSYIEIPMIDVELPIYHSVDARILNMAIGHLPGSSLPVGGKGTHCVISGHRGLPSAKLFTSLDQLKEGDIFMLHTLNQTMTYEVDQISIVLPEELETLGIDPEQDYCSLVTCTPYGVNTHRLIVRGHRVENRSDYISIVTADALQVEPYLVAAALAVPILFLLFVGMIMKDHIKKARKKKNKKAEVK